LKKLLLLLIPACLLSSVNDSIKKIEQFNQQKEIFQNFEKKKESLPPKYDIQKPQLLDTKSSNCVYIDKITDKDITLLSKAEKELIYKKYLNQCNSIEDLKNLTIELTSLYFDKGYITSKVYIAPQNIENKEVLLYALEGKVDKILPNLPYVNSVFWNQKGNHLNIRDIEASLEYINRLPSNHATIKLIPSQKVGFSDIHIENSRTNQFTGAVGLNNFGLNPTGKVQGYFILNIDNPLGLNDQISTSLNSSQNHFKEENSKSDSLAYAVPFGRLLTTLRLKSSRYKQLIPAGIEKYTSDGETKNYEIDFNYKVFHNRQNRINTGISISQSRTKNHLANTLLEMSSYNLSKISLHMDYLYQISNLYFFISFYHTAGTHWFDNNNPTTLNDKYKIENLTLSFMKDFELFKYTLNGYFQYTKDSLFNSNQLSIGGAYGVRGYQEESLNGNTGYYLRNEFSRTLSQKAFDQFTQTYFLALDHGWIKKELDTYGGSLLSYSIGAKYSKNNFDINLCLSIPLRKSVVSKSSSFLGINLEYRF